MSKKEGNEIGKHVLQSHDQQKQDRITYHNYRCNSCGMGSEKYETQDIPRCPTCGDVNYECDRVTGNLVPMMMRTQQKVDHIEKMLKSAIAHDGFKTLHLCPWCNEITDKTFGHLNTHKGTFDCQK